MAFKIGTKVIIDPGVRYVRPKNQVGRGSGVGEIVEPLQDLATDEIVRVKWESGEYYELAEKLIRADKYA